MTENDVVLYRTASGKKLHFRGCAHLQDTAPENLIEVTPDDRAGLPLCPWTEDELAGTGRRYFGSVEEAFEALPVPLESRPRVRQVLSSMKFDRVWLPKVGQYIAVGPTGAAAVAYINRGYIDVRMPEGGYEREPFPNYGGGSRGSSGSRTVEMPMKFCPQCHTALPSTGKCDECDA